MIGRNKGEIVRGNGVMSMVDVSLEARKGSGCQFNFLPVKGETPMCSDIPVCKWRRDNMRYIEPVNSLSLYIYGTLTPSHKSGKK